MATTTKRRDDDVENLFPAPEGVEEIILEAEEALATQPMIEKAAIATADSALVAWSKQLDNPLDMSVTKTRKGAGGTELTYLEWHFVTRQLNRIFGYGHWSTEIKEVRFLGGDNENGPRGVMVRMQLVVEFEGMADYPNAAYSKSASFENTGYAPNKTGSWDMLEMAVGAATQTAFKRCATALGDQFGLSLYEKEKAEETTGTANPTPARSAPPSSPAPSTPGSPLQYLGQSSFDCQDCGREVQGYSSAKTGKSYTTQDLWDMSIKQTGGLYCFNCKMKHAKR